MKRQKANNVDGGLDGLGVEAYRTYRQRKQFNRWQADQRWVGEEWEGGGEVRVRGGGGGVPVTVH